MSQFVSDEDARAAARIMAQHRAQKRQRTAVVASEPAVAPSLTTASEIAMLRAEIAQLRGMSPTTVRPTESTEAAVARGVRVTVAPSSAEAPRGAHLSGATMSVTGNVLTITVPLASTGLHASATGKSVILAETVGAVTVRETAAGKESMLLKVWRQSPR